MNEFGDPQGFHLWYKCNPDSDPYVYNVEPADYRAAKTDPYILPPCSGLGSRSTENVGNSCETSPTIPRCIGSAFRDDPIVNCQPGDTGMNRLILRTSFGTVLGQACLRPSPEVPRCIGSSLPFPLEDVGALSSDFGTGPGIVDTCVTPQNRTGETCAMGSLQCLGSIFCDPTLPAQRPIVFGTLWPAFSLGGYNWGHWPKPGADQCVESVYAPVSTTCPPLSEAAANGDCLYPMSVE